MPRFLLHHRHDAHECGVVFASFKGHQSPLRHRTTLASCATGGHAILVGGGSRMRRRRTRAAALLRRRARPRNPRPRGRDPVRTSDRHRARPPASGLRGRRRVGAGAPRRRRHGSRSRRIDPGGCQRHRSWQHHPGSARTARRRALRRLSRAPAARSSFRARSERRRVSTWDACSGRAASVLPRLPHALASDTIATLWLPGATGARGRHVLVAGHCGLTESPSATGTAPFAVRKVPVGISSAVPLRHSRQPCG
jgi:hypothetical protein